MKKLVLVLFAAIALVGCGTTKLEPGGAYAPVDTNGVATVQADYDFYIVDSAFGLAYDDTQTVLNFERTNRQMLWTSSPNITRSLDVVRGQSKDLKMRYALARVAYEANPVPANLSTLQSCLAKAQQL